MKELLKDLKEVLEKHDARIFVSQEENGPTLCLSVIKGKVDYDTDYTKIEDNENVICVDYGYRDLVINKDILEYKKKIYE